MSTSSLTSKKPASKDQARRVRALSMEAIEKVLDNNEGFSHDELQVVHANAAPYKHDLAASFTAFVHSYAKKLLGIVTPIAAKDTGLVPQGWKVKKDKPEGDVDLTKLDYSCLADKQKQH